MFRSLSARVLVALVAGLGIGVWIQAAGGARWLSAAETVESFGALWLNALRMTVVPLVFSLLVTGIAAVADAAKTGRLAGRAVALFIALLFCSALFGVAAMQGFNALWPVDREAAAAFIAGAQSGEAPAAAPLDFGQWLQSLAPANAIRAAAEDAVLPLVVFAAFFGFAATRIAADQHEIIVNFFRAVSQTMLVIVHWVLLAAPIGVFALALGVGARAGIGAAGVLLHYVTAISLIPIGAALIAFILAIVWGRVPIGRMAAAAAQPWAVAFSTRSSLASLPAMLEAARDGLRIPDRVADVVLPLAVAVFRITGPATNLGVAFFIVHLNGLEPSALQIAAAIVISLASSISAVGLPGQVSFFASISPLCLALGAPLDLMGVLLAVEVVPDIFRTVGNVTGDLAATAIVNRHENGREPEQS